MVIVDYTLCSINKNFVFGINEKFYNAHEVKELIESILASVDHVLKPEDTKKKAR